MRLTIVTGGSRGDIQPFVALGVGLRAAGHEVTLATYDPYEGFVRARGLAFARLSGDPRALVEYLLEAGLNPVRLARRFGEVLEPLAETNFEECLEACQHADCVIYTAVGYLGYLAAQKLGVPRLGAELQPIFTPTREFPCSLVSSGFRLPAPLRGTYNRLTYAAMEQTFWLIFRRSVNDLRTRKLDVSPAPIGGALREMRRNGTPVLYGWSPSVLPPPKDWGPSANVTGYWFLDGPDDWKPPEELKSFLDRGPAPVCVGFGSMNNRTAEHTTEVILEALRSTRQRGILLTGWGGISNEDLPDEVLKIEEAPHDWLFPRVRAIVHHGGAGTVAAAVRAGRPSITIPFFSDQPFWGRRLEVLGAGTSPIPHSRLSPRVLVPALRRAVNDPILRVRSAALGRRVRSEEGIRRAISIVERHVSNTS